MVLIEWQIMQFACFVYLNGTEYTLTCWIKFFSQFLSQSCLPYGNLFYLNKSLSNCTEIEFFLCLNEHRSDCMLFVKSCMVEVLMCLNLKKKMHSSLLYLNGLNSEWKLLEILPCPMF